MKLLQLKLDMRKAQRELSLMGRRERAHFQDSVRKTGGRLATEIKREGDQRIRNSGNFSERWPRAFEVQETESTRRRYRVVLGFNSSIPYAHVHEFGALIRGNPFLWIPLPWTGLKGVYARNFPGRLKKVERAGRNPLLFSVADKQAKYVGVRFVRLRPRFGLRAMAAKILRLRVRKFYDFWTTGGR